jgi:sulfocyanin
MLLRAASVIAIVVLLGAAKTLQPLITERSVTTAPAAPAVTVNKFLSYDPAAKKITLKITSALTSKQGGFNFNGGSNGDQTITVPLGWQVHVDVNNIDAIPHSAIIIPDAKPLPAAPDQAAIGGAYTIQLAPSTGHDTMDFKAAPAGKYLIACGIPGHTASGMYIRFVVDGSATVPTYTGL